MRKRPGDVIIGDTSDRLIWSVPPYGVEGSLDNSIDEAHLTVRYCGRRLLLKFHS